MDPIAEGFIQAVIVPVAEDLLKPESVKNGIRWLWSAAEHFLQARRAGSKDDNLAPEGEGAASSTDADPQTLPSLPIKADIAEWRLDLLVAEVENQMKLIRTYFGNLDHYLQQAALDGGEELAPVGVKNRIKLQRAKIIECCKALADLMYEVYGVKAGGIDDLVEAFKAH
jgi:hypothetical protein